MSQCLSSIARDTLACAPGSLKRGCELPRFPLRPKEALTTLRGAHKVGVVRFVWRAEGEGRPPSATGLHHFTLHFCTPGPASGTKPRGFGSLDPAAVPPTAFLHVPVRRRPCAPGRMNVPSFGEAGPRRVRVRRHLHTVLAPRPVRGVPARHFRLRFLQGPVLGCDARPAEGCPPYRPRRARLPRPRLHHSPSLTPSRPPPPQPFSDWDGAPGGVSQGKSGPPPTGASYEFVTNPGWDPCAPPQVYLIWAMLDCLPVLFCPAQRSLMADC